ncbi:MAG: YihY/virulence factor BrkB family protein [Acidimicrobiales bacterium]
MTVAGLGDQAKAVAARMKADNVSLLASAVAFWAMLALVPALVALVSLYGLVADPADIERQVTESTQALPVEAQRLIVTQLQAVVDAPAAGLGTGLIIGLAVALWAASAGMRTLTTAIGVVYGDQAGDRGALAQRGQALALTLGAVAFVAASVALIALLPADNPVVSILRWPLLGGGLVLAIGVLYRLGPASRPAQRLLTPGAVTAAVLCVVVSLLFSVYTSTFGSYNETYGSLAAVVILLLWLQLTAMTVLVGAELNQVLQNR